MKKDDIYRSQFRLPYSLYEKLKEAADANNRSVNAELVYRLELSLPVDTDETKSFVKSLNNDDINNLDDASKIWANRLSRESNKNELEALTSLVLKLISSSQNKNPR